MYALFQGKTQLGGTFATEKEVWEAALVEGLVEDVPVADEEGGQILPRGYQVREVEEFLRSATGLETSRVIASSRQATAASSERDRSFFLNGRGLTVPRHG